MADYSKEIQLQIETNANAVTQQMVDLSSGIRQYKEELDKAKEAEKNLRAEKDAGLITDKEYDKQLAINAKNQQDFTNQLKNTEAQLKLLNSTSLSDLWNGLKKGVASATSLKSAIGVLSSATKGFFKMLSTNPYGIIIAAVGLLIKQMMDIIKKNDTLATSFQKLGAIAQIPLKLIEKLLTPILEGIVSVIDKITAWVSKNSDLANSMTTLIDLNERLEDAENEYKLAAAATAVTLNNLKTIYKDSTKPIKERINALREAKEAELALAELQLSLAQMHLQASVLAARTSKEWKKHQLTALDLIKYDPTKTLTENIENFKWQMGKLGDLSQDLKDELTENFIAVATNQHSLSEINAKYVKEESSLLNKLNQNRQDNNKKADELTQQSVKNTEKNIARLQEIEKKLNSTGLDAIQVLTNEYTESVGNFQARIDEIDEKLKGKLTQSQKEALEAEKKSILDLLAKTTDQYEQTKEQILSKEKGSILQAIADAENALSEDTLDSRLAKEEQAYNKEIEALKSMFSEKTQTTEEFYRLLELLEEKHNRKMQDIRAEDEQNKKSERQKDTEKQQKIEDEIAQARISNMNDGFAKQRAQEEQNYKKSKRALQQRLDDGLITQEQYNELSAELQENHDQELARIHREEIASNVQAVSDILGSAASVFGSIANAYQQEYERIVANKEQLTEDEKNQAIAALEAQKRALVAQFVMQQAQSIGNAVVAASSAASMSGIAAAVVYIATFATLLTGIMSGISHAKQSMQQIDAQIEEVKNTPSKFAAGGYVSGAGTATSDSIPARLSNGESVINARSTAMFYDLLSRINVAGGGRAFPDTQNTPVLRFASGGVANSNQQLKEALREAVKGVQPVVSVREITKAQNKLKIKEGIL